MKTRLVRFHCPACEARIKAALALAGRRRRCPRCRHAFVVPSTRAEEYELRLVPVEKEDYFSLVTVQVNKGEEKRRNAAPRRNSAEPLAVA